MATGKLGNSHPPPAAKSPAANMAELDSTLHNFGFQIDVVSAVEVTGHLRVTERCCQISAYPQFYYARRDGHIPRPTYVFTYPDNTFRPSSPGSTELRFFCDCVVIAALCLSPSHELLLRCILSLPRPSLRSLLPFKVLHGGVTALISEGIASMGAHVASGFRRIAGVQLTVNHLRTAAVGDLVFARASPQFAGKSMQVWEVLMWKMNESTMEKGALIASSKVTLLSNLPVPPNAKNADNALRKYAKL